MSSDPPISFVAFACSLADEARRITIPAAMEVQSPDNKAAGCEFDPVTEADREAERTMRALIEAHYPDHGIIGEELGVKDGSSDYSWSIDPIDGTGSFICGLPSWTTLVALIRAGEPLIGIIDAPMVGERYIGSDSACRLVSATGARTLATSGCTKLSETRLSTTDPHLFDPAKARAFARLRKSVQLTRYGHDGYAYARLAAGGLDLVAESGLLPHDVHALVPVVRGAGGVIGNWSGGKDLAGGDVLAAASEQLLEQAVAILNTG